MWTSWKLVCSIPRRVSRTALQHAASVVGLLLTTEVLITEAPEAPTAPHDGMDYHRRGTVCETA
jgi:chaperonin GroEL